MKQLKAYNPITLPKISTQLLSLHIKILSNRPPLPSQNFRLKLMIITQKQLKTLTLHKFDGDTHTYTRTHM